MILKHQDFNKRKLNYWQISPKTVVTLFVFYEELGGISEHCVSYAVIIPLSRRVNKTLIWYKYTNVCYLGLTLEKFENTKNNIECTCEEVQDNIQNKVLKILKE